MAQEVMIAGAIYEDVPEIQVPDSNNVFHSFTDVSGTTATASDVATGKTFFDALGSLTTGTASIGIDYEVGEYKPGSDTAQPTITFTKTHTGRPIFALISDVTGDTASQNSMCFWWAVNWYDANGTGVRVSSSQQYYMRTQYGYKTSSSITQTGTNVNNTSNISNYVSATNFTTTSGSSYYFRSGRTYKWIAVWKP